MKHASGLTVESGRCLLDTNIVIAYLGNEKVVVENVGRKKAIYLSSTIAGELYFGVFNSIKKAENIQKLEHYLSLSQILPVDGNTAKQHGQIKTQLRQKGQPIPENDIWIAAIARQYSILLITRDKHFTHIHGLLVEMW